MVGPAAKNDVIQHLKKEILSLEGYKRISGTAQPRVTLGIIDNAFPGHTFPLGAVHEFISNAAEDAAATNGFISGIAGQLMHGGGTALWISTRRTIFPQALAGFGISPERIIFIDLQRNKEALWAIEEALKCEALSAVVGELGELNFTQSRRLQLAVEQSHVTGLIHHYNPKNTNAVACLTRWKIKHAPAELSGGLPGVGFPNWHVQLLKVRSGRPGAWHVEWSGNNFHHIERRAEQLSEIHPLPKRKTG